MKHVSKNLGEVVPPEIVAMLFTARQWEMDDPDADDGRLAGLDDWGLAETVRWETPGACFDSVYVDFPDELGESGSGRWRRLQKARATQDKLAHWTQLACAMIDLDEVSADQKLSRAKRGEFIEATQVLEQGLCPELDDSEAILVHLKLEMSEHPLSRDWDGRQEAKDAFRHLCLLVAADQEVFDTDIDPALLRELNTMHPNGAILVAVGPDHDGERSLHFFGDPVTDLRLEAMSEAELMRRKYPGIPEGLNPKAGHRLAAEDSKAAILAAVKAAAGERLSARAGARWVNDRHEELFPAGSKYMSESNFDRIRREMVKAGELVVTREPETYRKMHTCRTIAAAYRPATPAEYRDRQQAIAVARRALELKIFGPDLMLVT
jgi:hypothetical protein